MDNKAFSYYKELPSWAKGVVVIGGIAIVYFTAKQLIDRIKKEGEIKKQTETIKEEKQDLEQLQSEGKKATFNESQYKIWADAIQSQFKGCDTTPKVPFAPTTTFWVITNWSGSGASFVNIISKFKNDIDFLKLNQAWGIRSYPDCLWGTITGTLPMALRDELDDSEIESINKALAKQGIKYQY
jgi:hypothetical protein